MSAERGKDADGEPATKRHRWEEPAEAGGRATESMPTTRWSSATPRQYGGETPRVATGLAAEQSAWRGMSTPTATPYGADLSVATPRFGGLGGGATPSMMAMAAAAGGGASMGGMTAGGTTPFFSGGGLGGATPRAASTPMMAATPLFTGATPAAQNMFGATPNYQFEGTTPVQSHFATAEGAGQSAAAAATTTAAIERRARQLEKEWRMKNKRLTSEYLDTILPAEFFEVVPVPADYNPPPPEEPNFYEMALKSLDTFAFMSAAELGEGGGGAAQVTYDIPDSLGEGMPAMRPEDAPVFVELLKFHKVDPVPDEHLPSYLLMKNLFKLKNGDSAQRRSATRYLLDKSTVFGSSFIFQRMFHIWSANVMDLQQKHYFIDFIKALIARMQREVRGSTREVVHMMEPLLSAQESLIREDGKQVLTLLTRVVGFQTVFDAIKEDFAHEEHVVRRHTAKVVAIMGYASGTEVTLGALRDMSYSPVAFARQTVARSLADMATLLGHATMAALPDMVAILERLIRDEKRVRREAAGAVAAIAEAVAPAGIDELAPLVDVVCEECQRSMGSTVGPFLQAFGALVPLMAPYDAQARTAAMMPTLVNQFSTPEDDFRRVMLNVVRKCVSAEGVTRQFIAEVILDAFFDGFWRVRRVAADRRTTAVLIATTVEMARKLGSVDLLLRLAPEMKDENEQYQRMVMEAVRKIVAVAGTEAAPDSLVAVLLDGAIAAVRLDELGTNKIVLDGLATICNSLGARLKPYLKQIFDLVKRRRESKEGSMRGQAAELVARIAHTVMLAEGSVFLQDLGLSLYERLEDADAVALSANLRATRAILAELGARRYKPSVRELLRKMTFVIKNRYSNVQENAIALIEDIATNYEADVDAIHLHELATKGLFELLDADRRQTRRACTRTFGVIARTIRPFAIILELVDNFRQDKRNIRNCTAIALGAIARSCGAFTVVPYLLNEYKVSEGEQVAVIVQHSILKAIRYIFEFIGPDGRDYVYAFVPLLDRALTETSLPMRRMAVEACRAIVMAVAGSDGFAPVTLHLLNLVQPNIVELLSRNEVKIGEERLKMVTAVVSYYEAARLVLGSGVVLQYLQQGLFHPARKVRDIYRRTYNMIYVASPDNLVPYYPRIEDDAAHTFVRYELEVLV